MPVVDLSAVAWRKSSRSGTGSNDACVEVAFAGTATAIRDSKTPGSGVLLLDDRAWSHFTAQVRAA